MQNSVAAQRFYDAAPALVQETMDEVGALTGRQYKLFDYHGHPEADRVAVAMGSATSTVREAVVRSTRIPNDSSHTAFPVTTVCSGPKPQDHLNAQGERTGLLKVRLYRPWDADAFRAAIPATARDITVLDRTREDGAVGQPLFLDVNASFGLGGESRNIVGGQYGLASKEFTPKHVVAAFDNMRAAQPKHNYVVGIRDDVTCSCRSDGSTSSRAVPERRARLVPALNALGARAWPESFDTSPSCFLSQAHFA